MKRHAELWQRKVQNVFIMPPLHVGFLTQGKCGKWKQDTMMKVHLVAALNWPEEDKYKNKLRLWKHKETGGSIVELDSQEHSSPPTSTEMAVESEGGNIIQDSMDSKQPELELSLHVPPNFL